MKIKNIFENPIMKERVSVIRRRKKTGDGFTNFYYIEKKLGEAIGRPMGYEDKTDAVRDLMQMKDPSFLKKNIMRQKECIDKYIKAHKLQ